MLVPIVVMVMIALMYASFYLHDRVVCQTVLEKQAQRQERIRQHPVDKRSGKIQYDKLTDSIVLDDIVVSEEEKTELFGNVQGELEKRLWIGKVKNVDCEISAVSVTVEAVIATRLPIGGLLKYLGGFREKAAFHVKAPVHNPEELVRAYTAVDKED